MRLNGTQLKLASTKPLLTFLEEHGFNPARVAVEQNGIIVTRSSYTEIAVTDSDKLEVVSFVGGG
ncbi:MAG: sulfur carrier protein ThiS [Acidaminococcaceae bacterium]